jgi:hypothetical protein
VLIVISYRSPPPPDQPRDEDEQLERDDDPADGDVRVEDPRVAEDLVASR